jgi:hypothetical protein
MENKGYESYEPTRLMPREPHLEITQELPAVPTQTYISEPQPTIPQQSPKQTDPSRPSESLKLPLIMMGIAFFLFLIVVGVFLAKRGDDSSTQTDSAAPTDEVTSTIEESVDMTTPATVTLQDDTKQTQSTLSDDQKERVGEFFNRLKEKKLDEDSDEGKAILELIKDNSAAVASELGLDEAELQKRIESDPKDVLKKFKKNKQPVLDALKNSALKQDTAKVDEMLAKGSSVLNRLDDITKEFDL